MTIKFIHTADVHLDSPLHTLAVRDPEIADIVGMATRQAFVNIIDLCFEENVDALLIAGDLYDGELRSMKTAAFLVDQLRRLTSEDIHVFIIKGNHDAESKITRHVHWPEGVHVFSGRGESIELDEFDAVIHGLSFAKPHMPESLLPKYKPAAPDRINIGLLHTSLGGDAAHDVYAPCSIQNLIDQGYDYWALGHIHKRSVNESTACTIVMPGNPQGRSVREVGPRSVTLVEISDDRSVTVEERSVAVAQFERLDVDIAGIDDWGDMVVRFENVLAECSGAKVANNVIVRLELLGATPLASRLRRDFDVLLEEARSAGKRAGATFIEAVSLSVTTPSLETKSSVADPVSELRSLMLDGGFNRNVVDQEVGDLLRQLQKHLPPELRDRFGKVDAEIVTLVDEYCRQGAEEVLARLESVEGRTE
ncbi:MAG: DNA repair exonuclease [Marinicaulis sp.]|nr:DNA repair exonuclease [Marinicaulis sp.]